MQDGISQYNVTSKFIYVLNHGDYSELWQNLNAHSRNIEASVGIEYRW